MKGIIGLEKKIGWYKLVAKTSEPENEKIHPQLQM